MANTYHTLKELRQRFFRGEVTREELEREVERITGRQMPLDYQPKRRGGENNGTHPGAVENR